MSDSKLRDVISQNVDDEKNINNETATEAKEPETPPVKETKEVEQEELLKVPVETKKLTPEQLEEIRSEWNRKYTQTRQKEKEELRNYEARVKEYEEKLQKLESRSDRIQNPDLQEQRQEVQEQFDLGNLTIEQYTAQLRALNAEDARRIAREVVSESEDQSNQQNMLVEFNRLDERFDAKYTDQNSPEYNATNAWLYRQVAGQMAAALDEHIARTGSSKGFDTKGKALEFIEQFDRYADEVVKSRVSQSTNKAQIRAQEVSRNKPRGTTGQSVTTQKRDLRSLIEANME